MTERQALEWAVLTNPADDLSRGVFADWLEEHGEYDRLYTLRDPPSTEYFIISESGASTQIKAVLRGLPAGWETCVIRRGFVNEIEADIAWLMMNAEIVFRHAPITRVGVNNRHSEYRQMMSAAWSRSRLFGGGLETRRHMLPEVIWNRLKGFTEESENWRGYDDTADANKALSDAYVSWGRDLAGLPQLQ